MEINRGDVFYVNRSETIGSEQPVRQARHYRIQSRVQ